MNALNWFEIYVSNLDQARAFYATILGQELPMSPPGPGPAMAFFPGDMENGVCGSLTSMDGFGPGPGGTLIYLNVEGKLDEVIDRIPEAGGTVIRPKFPIPPHGHIAIFSDPEGNVVGLHSLS